MASAAVVAVAVVVAVVGIHLGDGGFKPYRRSVYSAMKYFFLFLFRLLSSGGLKYFIFIVFANISPCIAD